MIYRLLGELQVGEDGLQLDLPSGATLLLLTALLLNANRRLPKSALIRAAWGDRDVGEPQLPKRIKMVRELLAAIGRQDDVRTHPRFGYEMRVSAEDVDVLLFHRLVQRADEAAQGHIDDEMRYLRDALRLWRGPHPVSNVPDHAFRHERLALEQRHKRAAVRLAELEFMRGNYEGILDELILTAGYYPADRRLSEQLMRAEYRAGHVADVGEAYERYRAASAAETGSDPDPLLRNYHFAVARGDELAIAAADVALANRSRTAGRQIAAAPPAQLPRAVDLVGRDDVMAKVAGLLRREHRAAVPVIVISGTGGIGKTALALRAAQESRDRYPDGQLYAELRGGGSSAADVSEVVAQFLRALGAPRIPDSKAERLAEYRTLLASRRVLIVLDDAADGSQVNELAPANAGCAVLVTSRQRLPEVNGAYHVAPLEPLGLVDAAELFLRVVHDAGVTIDSDQVSIDRVVALCAGMPLALRIAGALRVHDHPRTTYELAVRLAGRGSAAFAFGKLSVARTIGAGFERLDPPARRLFLGLGLLRLATFGLWTAAALLGDAEVSADCPESLRPGAATALSSLASSFMIEPLEPEMRYRYHDLTRDYARRRALAEYPGDRDQVPVSAYSALLTLVRRAHAALYGGDFEVVHSDVPDWSAPPEVLAEIEADPLGWFEKERLNIRAAVAHCSELGLVDLCWDLAVSAHEFYTIRGYYDDWYETHALALAACRTAASARGEGVVLSCLNQPALVASRRTDSATTIADLERAVALLADSGDQHGQAIALRTLAHALRRQGHLTRPLALFNEVLARYIASGDQVGRWQTLRFIGQTYLDRGDIDEARSVLETAETIATRHGSDRLIAQTRYWIGQACIASGDIAAAEIALDAVFDVYRDDHGVAHGYARHGMGELAWRAGAFSVADQHLAAAATAARKGADAGLEGRVWLSIAALRHAEGRLADQVAALQRAVDIFADHGAVRLQIRALAELAQTMAERGDTQAADMIWARIEDHHRAAELPEQDRISRRPLAV